MGAQHIVMGVSEGVAATGASVQCRMHYQEAAALAIPGIVVACLFWLHVH
jgi:hypothetical protein